MELEYYKLEQRDNFDMKKTRTVYKLKHRGLLSDDDFINMVVHRNSYNATVIAGVLKDVAEEMALMLGEGRIVKVPYFGTFSLGIRLEETRREQLENVMTIAEEAAEEGLRAPKIMEPNAKHIKLHHINFCIDKSLFKNTRRKFDQQKLQRIYGREGVRITIDDMKQSERIAAARAYLKENPFMHVGDYASLTGLSYSSAQRELKELEKFKHTGITSRGRGSHLVYVLRKDEPQDGE